MLRQLARVLAENSRKEDTVARFGGEEFTVILPETTAEGATHKAERLRGAIEGHRFTIEEGGAEVNVMVSIGVALFPQHGRTLETLIAAADQALYRSKQGGRNRVTTATRARRSAPRSG